LKFEVVPAHQLPFETQAKVFTDAFTGYVAGSFQLDANSLAAFLCAQGIDLCYSRFARSATGQLLTFGYINRTGNVTRLGAMGTVSAARRSGAATWLLSRLLEEARHRGDKMMMLEVIEQNPPAVALYQSHGFETMTRLFGWRIKAAGLAADEAQIHEMHILDALNIPSPVEYPTLSWPISRHAAAKVAAGRAFRLDDVAVVTGDPAISPIRLHAYLGFNGSNWQSLRRLTNGVLAKFAGYDFFTPPIFPEEFGTEIFRPLKFRQESINQFLMRKHL
jgi:GNAT superfamily N-acetyltransferase